MVTTNLVYNFDVIATLLYESHKRINILLIHTHAVISVAWLSNEMYSTCNESSKYHLFILAQPTYCLHMSYICHSLISISVSNMHILSRCTVVNQFKFLYLSFIAHLKLSTMLVVHTILCCYALLSKGYGSQLS